MFFDRRLSQRQELAPAKAALFQIVLPLSLLACVALGVSAAAPATAIATPTEVGQAPVGVVARLDPACDAADAETCTALAYQLFEGDRMPKDEAAAVRVFAQACQFGSMRACTMAGYAYAEGEGVEAELTRAASYYAIASRRRGHRMLQSRPCLCRGEGRPRGCGPRYRPVQAGL